MKISGILIIVALFLNVTSFALNPSKEYSVKPDEYGMNYKTIKIPTDEGLQLNAWYFPSPQTSYKKCSLTSATLTPAGTKKGNYYINPVRV